MKVLSAFVALMVFGITTLTCVGSVFAQHYMVKNLEMEQGIVNFGLIAANIFLFVGMMVTTTILLSNSNDNSE